MKLHYYPNTDTLSIKLKDTKSANTKEIADDVVLDFGAESMSQRLELTRSRFLDNDLL